MSKKDTNAATLGVDGNGDNFDGQGGNEGSDGGGREVRVRVGRGRSCLPIKSQSS